MKQPLSGATVAVTGASGHIGVNLVRALLAEGRHVRVLEYSEGVGYSDLDIEIIKGNVLDEKSLCKLIEGADTVYHLAAKIYLGKRSDLETDNVNIIGSRNVAKTCLQYQVKRLVHFSSVHALSPYPVDGVIDETRSLITDQRSPYYDRSKAAGEQEIYAAVKKGLNAVVVSPCGVIGPMDFHPSGIGKLLIDLKKMKFFPLCKGGFNWVDVRDVAAGALAAEKHGRTGERYLLAGEWLSLREIAYIVDEYSSKRSFNMVLPVQLAQMMAYMVEAYGHLTHTSPFFTHAAIHALQNYRYINGEKAKNEIGFSPRPIRQTILDTLAWYSEIGRI